MLNQLALIRSTHRYSGVWFRFVTPLSPLVRNHLGNSTSTFDDVGTTVAVIVPFFRAIVLVRRHGVGYRSFSSSNSRNQFESDEEENQGGSQNLQTVISWDYTNRGNSRT
jgi:hypothetical protein